MPCTRHARAAKPLLIACATALIATRFPAAALVAPPKPPSKPQGAPARAPAASPEERKRDVVLAKLARALMDDDRSQAKALMSSNVEVMKGATEAQRARLLRLKIEFDLLGMDPATAVKHSEELLALADSSKVGGLKHTAIMHAAKSLQANKELDRAATLLRDQARVEEAAKEPADLFETRSLLVGVLDQAAKKDEAAALDKELFESVNAKSVPSAALTRTPVLHWLMQHAHWEVAEPLVIERWTTDTRTAAAMVGQYMAPPPLTGQLISGVELRSMSDQLLKHYEETGRKEKADEFRRKMAELQK